ncbi:hypothetical protein I302_102872 [Kwoniella bestiolae CBS 10118]|uniref:Uncharacterized protein n=1 Tax=Kwoniella bestiolae CBS 10118 TaxID=1296100 RepID=A0A1B9GG85_9TREE|nr:hypothetical protein I302_01567 [Kwoniella bestiolae CBS 10118]OCF30049.1 hypothetical protein I302_01567 [Kwoniella bestiolae CBS 10118]
MLHAGRSYDQLRKKYNKLIGDHEGLRDDLDDLEDVNDFLTSRYTHCFGDRHELEAENEGLRDSLRKYEQQALKDGEQIATFLLHERAREIKIKRLERQNEELSRGQTQSSGKGRSESGGSGMGTDETEDKVVFSGRRARGRK